MKASLCADTSTRRHPSTASPEARIYDKRDTTISYNMKPSATMGQLPAELLDLILDQCDHASLKELRLTSQCLGRMSTPRVFEHVYMALFDHCLTNFVHLATSRLARHVRQLTFYSDVLPDWTYPDWELSIDFRQELKGRAASSKDGCSQTGELISTCGCDSCRARRLVDCPTDTSHTLPSHDFTVEELDAGWELYSALALAQQKWCTGPQHLVFKEHFARLPNIEQVSVNGAGPSEVQSDLWPIWRRLRDRILVDPRSWMNKRHLADEEVEGQAALSLLQAVGWRAQFSGTKPVTKMSVNALHSRSYSDLMGIDALDKQHRLNQMTDGFSSLTELKYRTRAMLPRAWAADDSIASETARFLRAATQLRRLHLAYIDTPVFRGHAQFQRSALTDLIHEDGVTWPHLEHLALSVDLEGAELVSCLRHHESIRSLELTNMALLHARPVLEEIPRVRKLDHVSIKSIWSRVRTDDRPGLRCMLTRGTDTNEEPGRSIKEYLLGKRKELPDLHDATNPQ